MSRLSHLVVVSFVGPSGAGKTTGIMSLPKTYKVLPERYMELNRHTLDNRLMLSKWAYIQYWFDWVLQSHAHGVDFLITDRCPLDTCAYVQEGSADLLRSLKQSMKELASLGISTKRILVTAPFDVLESRIQSRLKRDPQRLRYHEADLSHNKRAYDFYATNPGVWDDVIDTSSVNSSDLPALFLAAITAVTNDLK